MTLKIYHCKTCGDPFKGREADRKRGWAKFCSKSCKAIRQTQKTGIGKGGYRYYENGSFQMSIADLNACQN